MRCLISLVSLVLVVGCGINKEEHARLLGEAAAADKARCDAEMTKMQKAAAAERAKLKEGHNEVLASKDQMIGGLEGEVKKMGGDLASVRTQLGDRVTQLASTKSKLAATQAEVEQLRKLRAQAEAEAAQFKSLANKLKSMVDAGQLEVVMRKGRINLKLPDDVLFPSGSDRLKKSGREALVQVAAVLKDVVGREFLIAGHTDNIPVKRGGSFKSNWHLSTSRAVRVVNILIDNGVAPEALAAAGFGEFDPIASNDEAETRGKNRRLEIILLPQLEAIKFDS